MTLWIAIACMTGLTVWAMLLPLTRREIKTGGEDIRVYQAQLQEIDHDEQRGLIGKEEAGTARTEANRRILAAHNRAEKYALTTHNHAAQRKIYILLALAGIPALALSLYSLWGKPALHDQPLQARLEQPVEQLSPLELVQRVEKALETNPDDIRAWQTLAPVYRRAEEWDKAVNAYQQLVRLQSESSTAYAALGETQVIRDEGTVSDEALGNFERALNLQPDMPMALYYKALAKMQQGLKDEASAIWINLLQNSPDDASWRQPVKQRLVENAMAGIAVQEAFSEEEGKQIMASSPEEREKFIRAMVERLKTQLEQEPDNLDKRLRAMRAFAVMGEKVQAQKLYNEGKERFAEQNPALRRLQDLAVGLDIAEETQP